MQRLTTSSVSAAFLSLMFFAAVAVPISLCIEEVYAEENTFGSGASQTNTEGVGESPSNSVGQGSSGSRLANPLQADDIITFITQIIEIILIFALPIIVLFIMYGGYLLVVAQGNPGKITEARNAIFAAVIGGVIVLGTKIIIDIIQNTVAALGT